MSARWEDPGVVRGFSTAAANEVLLDFVRRELACRPDRPRARCCRGFRSASAARP